MQLNDLNGYPIEVTNLKEAIRIAAQYKRYRHENKEFSGFDKHRAAYWTDMYDKLIKMEKQLANNQIIKQ